MRHYPAPGPHSLPPLQCTCRQTLAGSTPTLAHAQTCTTHGPNVPVQTSNVAGTRIPTWDHRADTPSSVPWIPPFGPSCPFLIASHRLRSPRNPPLGLQTQALRFSVLPLTLPCPFSGHTRPCLLGLPTLLCLSSPHLPKITLKFPTTYSVFSAAQGGGLSLRLLAWSTHETKIRLHCGNCGPERRRDLHEGPQG